MELPQPDAQRQTCKATTDDRDRLGHNSTDFLSDEKMADSSSGMFPQVPVLFVRPEQGKFRAGKTRADNYHGIMTSDVIAPNNPKQPTAKH